MGPKMQRKIALQDDLWHSNSGKGFLSQISSDSNSWLKKDGECFFKHTHIICAVKAFAL
jgi:hypothetical protein